MQRAAIAQPTRIDMPKDVSWDKTKVWKWKAHQSGGASVDVTNAMPLATNTSAGTTASLTFSARLMRNIQKPDVLASSVAGGVAGVLGADTSAMRLFLGMTRAAGQPIVYTALQ